MKIWIDKGREEVKHKICLVMLTGEDFELCSFSPNGIEDFIRSETEIAFLKLLGKAYIRWKENEEKRSLTTYKWSDFFDQTIAMIGERVEELGGSSGRIIVPD